MVADKLIKITASDILIRDLITVTEDEKIRDVERKLFKMGIGGVPVVRNIKAKQKIVGMLTHRDILLAKHSVPLGGMVVKDLMSHNLVCVKEDSNLIEILRKLRDNNIERLPVIDEDGFLVGLIMHKDLLSKILETLEDDHLVNE
ncbi:MAG: CBS domain-containing protein [Promethearchaeota archaeon]